MLDLDLKGGLELPKPTRQEQRTCSTRGSGQLAVMEQPSAHRDDTHNGNSLRSKPLDIKITRH